ncbi:MAG: hypothetical protein GX189_00340 [Clostridiales bacterium]|nr:hypothetical protein [Clostridiales bacterium]
MGLIERKNSDVGRKPAKLSDLLRPKQKSAGQRPAPGTNGLIFFLLVLVALFFYVLLVKR